jgi:hypothetical protein
MGNSAQHLKFAVKSFNQFKKGKALFSFVIGELLYG